MNGRIEVVVIGGGIAGLAAAWELEHLSPVVHVTLVEASGHLGGWIRTERWGDVLIEHGPDSWVASKASATDFACALGLASDLIGLRPDQSRAGIVRRGRIVPMPDGLSFLVPTRLGSLLGSPLLSPWGKVRVLGEFLVPPRRDEADESLAAFVRRRFGREFYEQVAEPLLAGIYAGDAEQLSVLATYPQLRDLELRAGGLLRALIRGNTGHGVGGSSSSAGNRSESPAEEKHVRPRMTAFLSPQQAGNEGVTQAPSTGAGGREVVLLPRSPFLTLRAGMEQLVRATAASLRRADVRLGVAAARIRPQSKGLAVELADGRVIEADAVVLAVPAWRAAELLEELDPSSADLLRGIPYASSAAVTLVYERASVEAVARGRGFLVPAREGRPISAVTWVSNKFEGRAPEHLAVARVFLRGSRGWPGPETPPEALVAEALREFSTLTGVRAEPLHAVVSGHPRALPQYLLGHRTRIASVRHRLASWPMLQLAGAAYDGVGVADCIASGQRAARGVAAALGIFGREALR